jgi:hypothetical protein
LALNAGGKPPLARHPDRRATLNSHRVAPGKTESD